MEINPQLISIIEDANLDKKKAILYSLAIEHDLIDVLLDEGDFLQNQELENALRLNLVRYNPESSKNELVCDMYSDKVHINSDFESFIQLLKDKGLTSKGDRNNPTKYVVITKDTETINAFNHAARRLKYFNIDKLAEVVANYYRTTEMCMKLGNYLDKAVDMDYNSFKAKKFKGLM